MNALTSTYLNLFTFSPVPAQIVCSVGNYLGNDIWNVVPTESKGTTIQSYGTGDFLSYDGTNVVSSDTIYSWALAAANVPYAFHIQDTASGQVLGVQDNSTANGAWVVFETLSATDPSQAWFFIGKEPI
ncbi:hypothetical protein BV22DRAFT_1037630 [Leucogyrophana mollusca]|uniref:Uncharacterized protein n=1 Tax=Leucogyrophana mollusca TaxID=85980 RepID=A0ACB8BAH1_9AGAM|nr:hypothetical protein BV22DRAFT_1037630 [Leucogyrophana mollusca]